MGKLGLIHAPTGVAADALAVAPVHAELYDVKQYLLVVVVVEQKK